MLDAYEFVHRDELIGGAMKYTADKIREMTLKDIQQRGLRPGENGLSGLAAGTTRPDPSRWTDDEIDRVVTRAKNGERIIL